MMKWIFSLCLMISVSATGQTFDASGVPFGNVYNDSQPAVAPSFSPGGGTFFSSFTVTLITATSACNSSSYIVTNTTGAQTGGNLTGVTAGNSVSLTFVAGSNITVYAQIQNCPSIPNSTISSATYQFPISMSPVNFTSCSATATSATSYNCTIPSTTAGNALLWGCSTTTAGPSPTTTPSSVALSTPGAFNGTWAYLGASSNISGGLTSVTISKVAFAASACAVAEVSNLPTSGQTTDGTYGQQSAPFGQGASTAGSGVGITTTNSVDVIIGMLCAPTNPDPYSAGPGYTALGTGADGTAYACFLEFQNLNSIGSWNPTVLWTGTGYASNVSTVALVLP